MADVGNGQRQQRLCCMLVGLPARGKTYIARKMARYLNWLGIGCKVFNVGVYRRQLCGAQQPASFFDPTNAEAEAARRAAAVACLEDMMLWLDDGTTCPGAELKVAVYDATNSTRSRRMMVRQTLEAKFSNVQLLLIESVCDNQSVILENVRSVKRSSPDYADYAYAGDAEGERAVADFLKRIEYYARAYEPPEPAMGETPLVRLIDLGKRYEMDGVEGWWQARLALLLMNMQARPSPILLCRHGESEFNLQGRIGGDADLSPGGWRFAEALPGLVTALLSEADSTPADLKIWTSSFRRTKQTASFFGTESVRLEWKALDEIDAGVCEGLTYDEIASRYPRDFSARDDDKFRYRYRGGESYADLINRLEPIVLELERTLSPVLVVAHQAVLRAVVAYFTEARLEDLPYIRVPLHAVIMLVPTAYGCSMVIRESGIAAVDTHRLKSGPVRF